MLKGKIRGKGYNAFRREIGLVKVENFKVKRKNMALTFHPELSGDFAFHKWLINKAAEVSK